jgi:NADP-dependent 3-hydroxy acid dehydrogenase YdfG
MSTIEGKVVAITGASSGIGEAAARLLAERGANVVVGARRSERLEKLVAAIQAKKGEARFRTLDVTSREDMKAFMDFSKAEFGRVDVLVNNAGIMPLSPMTALKIDEWDRMIDVNIRGVLNGIAAVLPDMKARGSGHIVNVASIGAHVVVPTGAVYCATKFAVWALSEGLRQENPDIRVPRLEMRPRMVRSPVEICRGTSPSQAPKSRPRRKADPSPMVATMALAMIGPMPGTVISRWQASSLRARVSISEVTSSRRVSR